MKKVILSLSLGLAVLVGSAQQQTQPQAQPSQLAQQKPIIFQVTPEAAQLIIQALAELPAKLSYTLIQGLQQQYAEQVQTVAADTTKGKRPVTDKPKTEKKN